MNFTFYFTVFKFYNLTLETSSILIYFVHYIEKDHNVLFEIEGITLSIKFGVLLVAHTVRI